MKKYKIEFYSKLLDKRITKVVENPKDYDNAIILGVVEEKEQFDLQTELLRMNAQMVRVYRAMIGGAR